MTSCSSEDGEIVENGAKRDLKATSPPLHEGSGVDRRDRTRYDYAPAVRGRDARPPPRPDRRYSRSPDHGGARARPSRSPPPPAPAPAPLRNHKRARDDRDDRDGRDGRRQSRARYGDDKVGASRGRGRGAGHEYSRYREGPPPGKRPRSRSPPHWRSHPNDGGGRRNTDLAAKASMYDDHNDDRDADRGSKRTSAPYSSSSLSRQAENAKHGQAHTGDNGVVIPMRGATGAEGSREKAEPEPEDNDSAPLVVDEDAEIERRRRRREAILAKSSSVTPLLIHALHSGDKLLTSAGQTALLTPSEVNTPLSDVASPNLADPDPDSPGSTFEIGKEQDMAHGHAAEEDGPSAADYDPTADMEEDERRLEMRHGTVGIPHGQVAAEPDLAESSQPQDRIGEQRGKKLDGGDGGGGGGGDGDGDDDFDMFAEDFDEGKYHPNKPAEPRQASGGAVAAAPSTIPVAADGDGGGGILEDQDKDGYYKIRPGEIINGRYQVQAALGKGMFSGVLRAVDIKTSRLVAVKMMRNNDALRKGGFTEIAILQKLNEADPDGRKHIVRFERHFDHKGHLCLTFENLSMNLREVLRRFGNNVGINLAATRTYAYQIFVALAHMRRCSIVHADLKPDNILVSENRSVVKICDLGTAIDRSDAATAHHEVRPYLVSRFYRAPEIILGIPVDYAVDMWSIGCTLYELYTGKILFTGDSNNQMLRAMQEIRGRLTPKLYRRGELSHMHFDGQGNFISAERDRFGKLTIRTLPMVKPTRDLRARLTSAGMIDAEARDLNNFIDLLEHCLALNPDKRMKPADALKHAFFTSRSGKK